MQLISTSSVDVVIVTYGNRWKFLEQVLDRVTKMNEVNKVILIDNGTSYTLGDRIKKFEKIKLHSLERNEGSAKGFYQGIELALQEDGQYIWLLDDDNLPNKNALFNLMIVQNHLKSEGKMFVLSSFRNDRKELIENKGQKFYKNSFFEFHIKKKLMKTMSNQLNENNLLKCEAVPYGGLLLDKDLISVKDLPNENYFLYCDDIDFTYRLTLKGYDIYCATDSIIVDLESSWYRKEKVPMFKGIFKTNDLKRGLYSIRNRVYFEKKFIASSKLAYITNIFIYMVFVWIKYMPKTRQGFLRFFRICKAIRQGWRGDLGKEIQI
ncbi:MULTISPECIES: glycosyltransferase [Heyndrickxia]|uniref:glycosyltransferase n=1 Tax=Heyndrickxia TaxID=2837504 RepID=UPI0013150E8E|nr:glycosyltransferase [Heyndrickxia coagulans]